MDQLNNVMIQLIRAELCRISPDQILNSADLELLDSPAALEKLYICSSAHDLSHMVGSALYKLDLNTASPIAKNFKKAQILAVYRYEQISHELNCLYKLFAEIKVKYIPLKGSFIRKYYPQPDMRTSCDIDILVSPTDLDSVSAELINKLNYQKIKAGSHDVHFLSPSGVNIELHFTLIDEQDYPDIAAILSDVWNNTVPDDSCPYQYNMTLEFSYFYHIAHMVKHFLYGGCGIRTFMDLWIFRNCCPKLDEENIEKLLKRAKIDTFEKKARHMSEVWFSGIIPDADSAALLTQMEEYILNGGIYGSVENRVKMNRSKNASNKEYIRSRLFLPYDHLKYDYPILQKHKSLLPFCQIHRWSRLLSKGTSRRILSELKVNNTITHDVQLNINNMLTQLGINQ